MKTSKKKTIIISSIIAVVLVSALAILIFNNIKKERELQEAIKLIEQQEKEAQELKEQQEQEEKERQEQERLAKLEEGWNALGDNQQYLALNSSHLKRTTDGNFASFTYDIEFIDALYLINNGWFQGVSKEDLGGILAVALVDLPDNATGKQVYDALCDYTTIVNRDAVVTGEGTDVLQGLIEIEPDPTPNTNNNSGGGTGTSGGGNSSSNGGGSSSNTGNNNSSSSSEELGGPDMDGDGDYDAEDFAALGGGTTGPSEYDPDDMGDVELDWGTP